MLTLLAAAFGLTAVVYSLAGFAGGSTYLALLALAGLPHAVVPTLALICNIIVASGNSWRYFSARLLRLRLLVPHMALAIPFAYIGGSMAIGKSTFEWLTAFSLSWAALYLLLHHKKHDAETLYNPPPLYIALPAGGVLGFLSGLVGIGGGIFLAPLLYVLKAGSPKEIASTCSFFILVNSLAGLAGQAHKMGSLSDISPYWLLPIAVLIGGQLGSHLTLKTLSLKHITLITGVILLLIAIRMWWEIAMR